MKITDARLRGRARWRSTVSSGRAPDPANDVIPNTRRRAPVGCRSWRKTGRNAIDLLRDRDR